VKKVNLLSFNKGLGRNTRSFSPFNKWINDEKDGGSKIKIKIKKNDIF
jgi:hypothetical protein